MNAIYTYNYQGQHVAKSVNGEIRQFIYNQQGQLIAEADSAGNISSEYIFLNGELLAKSDYSTGTFEPTNASMVQEIVINPHWQSVSFDSSLANPVIIAGPATSHDIDHGTIQIHNVGNGSANIRFAEWEYLDGQHTDENVSLIALPQGRYSMADGSLWEIGTFTLSGDRVLTAHTFSAPFPDKPTLILTAQTANDGTSYSVRAKSVTSIEFNALINEQELNSHLSHSAETIAYVAIVRATGSGVAEFNGDSFQYTLSSNTLRHQWKTLNGYDLKVEEEQSKDAEIKHVAENIDLLLIDDYLFAQDVRTGGADLGCRTTTLFI